MKKTSAAYFEANVDSDWRKAGIDQTLQQGRVTARQKLFVRNWLSGKYSALYRAAEAAGISPTIARAWASLQLRKPKVQRYVEEFYRGIGMSKEEIKARLAMIARSNISDFLKTETDADGNIMKVKIDPVKVTDPLLAQSVKKVVTNRQGEVVNVVLEDKMEALVWAGRAHGLFVTDPDTNIQVNTFIQEVSQYGVNEEKAKQLLELAQQIVAGQLEAPQNVIDANSFTRSSESSESVGATAVDADSDAAR